MKRRLATIILLAFTVTSLVACGNSANVAESTADTVIETESDITEPTTPEQTETPHEHVFTETITKEATCLEAGEKTLACECGESSVEEVPATGHDFSNYVSNEDATYEADGTETAKCSNCDETDTRTADGSMLTYSFEDMDATKYAKSTVNVRSLPNSDGENLGGLSTNDEVKVTGKCNETGWYRIEYSDGIAYVSDEYLVDEKVEAQASAPAQANTQSSSGGYSIVLYDGYSYVNTIVSSYDEAVAVFTAMGYEPWVKHEENGTRWWYTVNCHGAHSNKGNFESDFYNCVFLNFKGDNPGNRIGTKDGRIYVDDVSGGSWSVEDREEN